MRKKHLTFNQIPVTYKRPAILQDSLIYHNSAMRRGPIIRQSYTVREGSSMYQSSLTKVYYDMQHQKYTGKRGKKRNQYLLSGIILFTLLCCLLLVY